jgi:small subunit ribosomal protein S4e
LGRFTVHRITKAEGNFKLCKVVKQFMSKNKVPVIVTHDGRTIRYPDPNIKVSVFGSLQYFDFIVPGQ